MRKYEGYYNGDGKYLYSKYAHIDLAAMLRDILAELERPNKDIFQLMKWAQELERRLAKLEDRLRLWENVPQTSVVEGEPASTDNINPFTPPGPTGKEIHQAFVQWMTLRAKLEEGMQK